MGGEAEGAAVPAAQQGSWTTFLKTIASFSGDLSSLTAPPFILSPTSLVEFPSYWGEPAEHFAAIADGRDAEQRMLFVLRWFISTLSGQFTRRETQTGSEKKPLNPILGEQFLGSWNTPHAGETLLCAEQVSHHPPVTAYCLQNKAKKIIYQGHCAQKTSFKTGSIAVRQVGHGIVHLTLPDSTVETYLVTLPRLRIDGLWYGSPYVELDGQSFIQASTGWHAALEYRGKGFFSGSPHTFTAKVSPHSQAPLVYTIEGQWNNTSKYVKPCSGKHAQAGDSFLDSEKYPEITVAPLESQGDWESRKVWKAVSEGIRKGDFDTASREKGRLENEQRARRKEEIAEVKPWTMRWFQRVESDSDYHKLTQLFGFLPAHEDSYQHQEAGASPAAVGPWSKINNSS